MKEKNKLVDWVGSLWARPTDDVYNMFSHLTGKYLFTGPHFCGGSQEYDLDMCLEAKGKWFDEQLSMFNHVDLVLLKLFSNLKNPILLSFYSHDCLTTLPCKFSSSIMLLMTWDIRTTLQASRDKGGGGKRRTENFWIEKDLRRNASQTPHCTEEDTECQRGEVTCPRPHIFKCKTGTSTQLFSFFCSGFILIHYYFKCVYVKI